MNDPTLVTNWTQYTQNFGEFIENSYLAHSVYGYFLNGGGSCLCRPRRRRRRSRRHSWRRRVSSGAGDDSGKAPFSVKALESGAAGDDISVEVADATDPADGNFKLIVKKGGKVEETYDNVTLRKGANNVSDAVKAESKLISVEEVRGGGTGCKGARVNLGGGAARPTCRSRRPTTSVIHPTAPASAGSRRSTRSPW